MTTAVQTLLESFDALTDAERQEAALEILGRVTQSEDQLSDAALVEAADALFCMLDAEEEAANANPES
jgi:hypothetical protein